MQIVASVYSPAVRQRDWIALVVVWGLVLTGAFLAATLGADDDPATDDASGAGALAAIVGSGITALWFIVREVRTRREGTRAPDVTRPCPHCAREMSRFVRVCPHCGAESAPWVFRQGRWWTETPDGGSWVLDETANEWRQAPDATAAS